jgi:hypothetical protein
LAWSILLLTLVMPGLVPGIHIFDLTAVEKTWMARTSPAMTKSVKPGHDEK